MTTRQAKIFGRLTEWIPAVLLLSAYGMVLFFSDPEWVMWAGQMAMGSLYIPEPPLAVPPGESLEALRTASRLAMAGVATAAVLMIVAGELCFDAPSRFLRHLYEWLTHPGPSVGRHP